MGYVLGQPSRVLRTLVSLSGHSSCVLRNWLSTTKYRAPAFSCFTNMGVFIGSFFLCFTRLALKNKISCTSLLVFYEHGVFIGSSFLCFTKLALKNKISCESAHFGCDFNKFGVDWGSILLIWGLISGGLGKVLGGFKKSWTRLGQSLSQDPRAHPRSVTIKLCLMWGIGSQKRISWGTFSQCLGDCFNDVGWICCIFHFNLAGCLV